MARRLRGQGWAFSALLRSFDSSSDGLEEEGMGSQVLRLGVVTDLHHNPQAARQQRWINVYEPEQVLHRLRLALDWFSRESADLVIVLGDLVEQPASESFDEIFELLSAVPAAVVCGNHDIDAEGSARLQAEKRGIRFLDEAPVLGLVDIVGLTPTLIEGRSAFVGGIPQRPAGAVVVASHFPLLSEAERLASAGMSYPGDLVNRAELAAAVQSAVEPTLVLSGHIHSRCSRAVGSLLQLSCGALIEPPYDATMIEVEGGFRSVTRTAHRLGPQVAGEPVFVAEREQWEWRDGGWWAVLTPSSAAERMGPVRDWDVLSATGNQERQS